MYDVIIIGAGAAGITAAIYAARAKLSFEIISKDIGGLTLWSSDIENYTGFHNLTGLDLVGKFEEHMKDYKIKVKEGDTVKKVTKKDQGFIVETDKGNYETKTVLVASGSSPRKLPAKGADQYEKKGLFYCATCDGPLMGGKEAAVVGGGDAALDSVNTLLQYATKIYILNHGSEMTGTDKALLEKATKSDKVQIINNAEVVEVLGDKFLTGVKYKVGSEEKELPVGGLFVEIGHIRNVDFVEGLVEINDKKEIVVDKTGKTSIEGIYAAGDVTDLPGKQSIIAAGDGSRALLTAFNYITRK